MRKLKSVFWLLCLSLVVTSCASGGTGRENQRGRSKRIEGQSGRTLPFYGLSIDANYDARLDVVIPGYKLLPIVIKNSSLRMIPMDAKKDRWVVIGEKGKRYAAINTLRLKDPVAWRDVPERLRDLIDYPEVLPINYSVTFDILFTKSADLKYFKEIHFYSAALKQEFIVYKEY